MRHAALLGLVGTWSATGLAAQSTVDLVQRIAALPSLAAEQLADAMTAVADALPFADDPERRDAVAALRRLAATGLFCSPSANAPRGGMPRDAAG